MPSSANELREMVLRECAKSGDQPWYPEDYIRGTGVNRDQLDACLDELRLGGLLQLTEWVSGKGQGYELTPEGQEVVRNPRALNQLRQRGVPERPVPARREEPDRYATEPREWDRGKALADALMTSRQPTVTLFIIALNVINFVIGLGLAMQADVANVYLGFGSNMAVSQIRHLTGALRETSVSQGEWWRLLSCCFVHIGAIHLLLNMWVLFSVGPMLERVFGPVRFALLFLASGIGGSAAVVYFHSPDGPPIQLAGASGAICGLIGALLAWVWLNRAYISRASEWLRNIFVNIVLLTLISLIPQVSGTAHLGGGLIGLALAVPLNFHRFGTADQRWLGLVGTVALVLALAGSVFQLTVPASEADHARSVFGHEINYTHQWAKFADGQFRNWANDLKEGEDAAKERTPKVTEDVRKAKVEIRELRWRLAEARAYEDAAVNAAIQHASSYFEKLEEYFSEVQRIIDRDGKYTEQDVQILESRKRQLEELWETVNDSALGPFKN